MSSVKRKTWKEFQDSGLLWWVNRLLHTFGWAIIYQQMPDGTVLEVYPAKVTFRGFELDVEEDGYERMKKTMEDASK